MVGGGPNERNEYHVNETEVKSLISVPYLWAAELSRIEEGEMFLLPGTLSALSLSCSP